MSSYEDVRRAIQRARHELDFAGRHMHKIIVRMDEDEPTWRWDHGRLDGRLEVLEALLREVEDTTRGLEGFYDRWNKEV